MSKMGIITDYQIRNLSKKDDTILQTSAEEAKTIMKKFENESESEM